MSNQIAGDNRRGPLQFYDPGFSNIYFVAEHGSPADVSAFSFDCDAHMKTFRWTMPDFSNRDLTFLLWFVLAFIHGASAVGSGLDHLDWQTVLGLIGALGFAVLGFRSWWKRRHYDGAAESEKP